MIATATEVKNNFGKYLNEAMEDKEVVITKNGEKVARIVPYISDIERYFTIREKALAYEYDRKRVSYEEFMEIYENTESRMEFINGEIFILGSPSVTHQEILGELHVIFKQFFKGKKCKAFIAPFDVHFRKQNIKDPDVMQPDIMVICDLEETRTDKDRYMGTPTLVLEILSKSTKTKDLVYKLNTYMTSGVIEYWIVDGKEKIITVYNFKDYTIDSMDSYKEGENIKSEYFKGLEIKVDDAFDF